MTARTSLRIAGSVIAVAVALSGCATTDPPTSTSPSDSATPEPTTPSQSATPTAEADDPSDPSTWIIDEQGVGPVSFGDDRRSASMALAASYTLDTTGGCPNPDLDYYVPLDPSLPSLVVTSTNGVVDGFDVGGFDSPRSGASGPATEAGVQVGASEESVRAAYPGLDLDGTDSYRAFVLRSEAGPWTTFSMTMEPPSFVTSIAVFEGSLPPYEYCG